MPDITGISMSIVTTSGSSWATLLTAICPLAATPTTSISGSEERASVTRRRTTTESSTTSTVMGDTRASSWAAGVRGRDPIVRGARQLSGRGTCQNRNVATWARSRSDMEATPAASSRRRWATPLDSSAPTARPSTAPAIAWKLAAASLI